MVTLERVKKSFEVKILIFFFTIDFEMCRNVLKKLKMSINYSKYFEMSSNV